MVMNTHTAPIWKGVSMDGWLDACQSYIAEKALASSLCEPLS